MTGVDTSGVTCGEVAPSTAIAPTLAGGTYTLVPGSCSGVTLSGSSTGDYTVVFTSASGDFSVTGGPHRRRHLPHGYWLVGSDGGIFTFGSAHFYGSTGSLTLQRPVVGITPTADEGGYWLVASDGGIFAFGDAGFHGSIPGLGMAPAGSGLPNALERAHRGHGALGGRRWLLHGGIRRRCVRFRRRAVRGLVPGDQGL